MKNQISSLIILFCIHYSVQATHLIGGSLTYQYLTSTTQGVNYAVTLEAYRDMQNSTVEFDDEIKIGIYHNNASKSKYQTFTFKLITKRNLYQYCNYQGVGIEVGTFSRTITLPHSSEGFFLTFVRCCRGYSDNLDNNGPNGLPYQGSTFLAFIPPTADKNNSPVFGGFPKMINSISKTNFDFGATDVDGDSLVYSIVTPYAGGQPTQSGSFPDPPSNLKIPVTPVKYASGFSETKPLGTSGNVSIDLTSGKITYSNTAKGVFAFCVQIEEFRQGRLVGLIRREYPLIFINIPPELEDSNYLKLNQPQVLLDKTISLSWNYCLARFSKFSIERRDSQDWKEIRQVVDKGYMTDTISENVMYYYRVVGIRDTFRIVSNIDSVIVYSEKDVGPLIERINVFPNPFANSIDIKIENIKSPMTVSIYDMLGRMIYEGLLVENHHRVDASNFTGGVYFLRILRGSDRLYKNLMIQVKEK